MNKTIIITIVAVLILITGGIIAVKVFSPAPVEQKPTGDTVAIFGTAPTSTIDQTISTTTQVLGETNTFIDTGLGSKIASTTIAAKPNNIPYNTATDISWNSDKSSTCTSSGDDQSWFFTGGAPSGTFHTQPLEASRRYEITCLYPDKTQVIKSVIVTVQSKPTVLSTISNMFSSKPSSGSSGSTFSSFFGGNSGSGSSFFSTGSKSTPGARPTITLTTSPATVYPGKSVAVSWTSTDATSCATGAGGLWETPSQTLPTQGTTNTLPLSNISSTASKSYTLTLTCTGPGGTTQKTVVAVVSPSHGPSVIFIAQPTSVLLNQRKSTVLTWQIMGSDPASKCTASGDWSGDKDHSSFVKHTETIDNLTAGEKTFRIECMGEKGSSYREQNVLVFLPPPVTSMSIVGAFAQINRGHGDIMYYTSPPPLTGTYPVKIKWSTNQEALCEKTGDWSGSAGGSGSETIPFKSPGGTERYGLTCTNGGNTGSAEVRIRDGMYYPRDLANDAIKSIF